jgi:hypothetical protein
MRLRHIVLFFTGTAACLVAHGQIQRTTRPIGDAVSRALATGVLTTQGGRPFHVRIVVSEPANQQSPYQGTIEEWWRSPEQWRREVTARSGIRQTIVVIDGKKTEVDEGDYFPLWLRSFVTAVFDPVPNAAAWQASGGVIEQITLSDGSKSDACARAKSKIGSGDRATDAFSNVCFDGEGRLHFVGSPSYAMEFHDYRGFGKKKIARRLVDHPEPGTEIVGDVTVLEEMSQTTSPAEIFVPLPSNDDKFRSIEVRPEIIEQLSAGNPPIVWPPVHSGNIRGHLAIYISADSAGRVREAWPLNSDNAGLNDSVRDQVRSWKMKVGTDNTGKPVQVDGGMGFAFETRVEDPIPILTAKEMAQHTVSCTPIPISKGVAPSGTVITIRASVNEEGKTVDAEPGLGRIPWGLVAQSIISVRDCKFTPYIVNGKAVAYRGDVELLVP